MDVGSLAKVHSGYWADLGFKSGSDRGQNLRCFLGSTQTPTAKCSASSHLIEKGEQQEEGTRQAVSPLTTV